MKRRAKAKIAHPRSRYEVEAEQRRKILADAAKLSDDELFAIAVRAGIFTKKGRLRKPYRDEASSGKDRAADPD
ncbi:MAG: hypothetical protein HYV09_20640 [Deltaproteobacteria bacterium]|nr:hypothetical protein [Deltaproteobacteria bacterium]